MEAFPEDWQVFLGTVAGAGADESALIAKLKEASWTTPLSFVQADAQDVLETLHISGPHKAFVRRAVIAATKRSAKLEQVPTTASRSQELVPLSQPSQTQPELVVSMQSLLGTDFSALMVADALDAGVERLNVTQLMADATAIAKKKQLVPFTYVELTNTAMLQDFLPPEAIGGRTFLPGTDGCLNN